MGRPKGSKNRNFPPAGLEDSLAVATAIQDGASGMPVSRLTLAQLMDRSPESSAFRDRLLAARAYGLTGGGVNADHFALTRLGADATGGDEIARAEARRTAVLNIEPFRIFFTAYNNKRLPAPGPLMEFLTTQANVGAAHASDCASRLIADLRFAGLARSLKGSEYVELRATESPGPGQGVDATDGTSDSIDEIPSMDEAAIQPATGGDERSPMHLSPVPVGTKPKKVFIAHGKQRTPLEQLKALLARFKVPFAVAVDEPNKGRPISAKVATLMRSECSSAIFVFTADEPFMRKAADGKMEEVWRPSENVIFELGAASILYENRIVIFKEDRVSFPSDFSDLGFIEFSQDQLADKVGDLFGELVALDILEVRAKG